MVGIAVTALPDVFSCRYFQILDHILQRDLCAAGIEAKNWGGMWRPAFCVLTAEVMARNQALHCLRAIAADYGLEGIAEISYFDQAESYWRTVYPVGAEPFDRFLAKDEVEAAKAYAEHTQRIIAEAMKRARERRFLEQDTPPEG